ncbi:amidinotransferase [Longibacter salinarum]|uniref:arginine deiminase n=1 Tax=Longibacter salinarum TaxID=1850348 RepID=A0A2A8CZF2_9BACT|nr:arginine deiminase family protein [Longibacter salinarum]PEN14010.1 amidinotransferase [Longibacter salinarum]
MVYTSPDAIDFTLDDCPPLSRPQRVVLTSPDHFDVQYVINPHMSGNIGGVNRAAALQQWKALRAAYSALDIEPLIVDGQSGLPDMVFCANQTLPFHNPMSDTSGVVLSNMHAPERQNEVPHYEQFFRSVDYEVLNLPDGLDTDFEGMGDAIWHPGRFLLWGGYGFRTDRDTYEALSDLLGVRVLALALSDPEFYHLDTCFSVLDENSVLIYPGAFDTDGIAMIEQFFDTVVDAPEGEARHQFACNAHCPDGDHVFIQEGCTVTMKRLREAGFRPVELDTSEFLKSGGSVFCMKQMIW